MYQLGVVFVSVLLTCFAHPLAAKDGGSVVVERLASEVLKDNRIGIDPNRAIHIYLPPGYADSNKAYPVVYYLHNMWWSPGQLFRDNRVTELLDGGFAAGHSREFIFVAADFQTPGGGTIYENSPINGRWLDFIARELVPFVDRRFRTFRHPDSRAVTGDFFGGRGTLRMAMVHAETFGIAYALHPVATSVGNLPWPRVPIDWQKVYAAKSLSDLQGDGRAQIFVNVCQAFLPNPNRPPFYCDFFMELENGNPKLHVSNNLASQRGFLIDQTVPEYADNLRKLRALGFEWGRYDPTYAHVIANEALSRALEDVNVEHEANEFRGSVWDRMWGPDGRFATHLLPFLNRNLVFSQ